MTDAEWDTWHAMPGTDAFGHPWPSWIRNPKLMGKPMRISELQVEPSPITARNRVVNSAPESQMALGL
jgi:hypothetical protein